MNKVAKLIICIGLIFIGIQTINAQTESQADRLKALQKQLDEAHKNVGNEDDVDFRLISDKISELEASLRKKDSLDMKISLLTSELMITQAKLRNCGENDDNSSLRAKMVLFAMNSTALKSEDLVVLASVIDDYKSKQTDKKIMLIGHADGVGTNNYNLNLSKSRVLQVKKYLITQGIAANRIMLDYRGESDPLDTASKDKESEQNRRVELYLL